MKLDSTIQLLAADDPKITWITVNGQHIPIKEGQSKEDALKEHFDKLKALKPKKTKEEKWAEKQAKETAALAKFKQGLSSEKKLMGLWQYNSGKSTIYKAIMAGDWHKISDLQQLLGDKGTTAKQYLKWIENSGKRTDAWSIEWNKSAGTVRLVQKDFGNAAKGQVEITGDQQHAALAAVSKLIGHSGLDTTFSKDVMDQFMKDAGLSTLKDVSSMVKDWTGSATTEGGTWLRRIASEYYGRPWSSEYSGIKTYDPTKDKAVDPKVQEQVLAVKALATAYAQADGTQYLYRGIDVDKNTLAAIKLAKTNGEEYVNIPMNSLSSWSTRQNIGFGDITLRRAVDPDDVWFCNKAMAHLFSSHQHEQEWILGTKTPQLQIKTSDVWLKEMGEKEPPWKNPDQKYVDPDKPVPLVDKKTGVDYMETKIGGALGSNPGGTYKGSDGVTRYIKFYNNPEQGQGESLANKIYSDLGIGAPKSTIIDGGAKQAYASDVISGGKTLQQQGTSAYDAGKVMHGFAADVLMANWDAVGTGLDNILMKDGQPYRIDNGAAFLYRAQGQLKPEEALHKITEWDKFFDTSTNKHYAGLAAKAGITKAEDIPDIKQQVKDITKLRDSYGGWANYIEKNAPYVKDKSTIAGMLESRMDQLENKVIKMTSVKAGGPGSGRKPKYAKGLNQWKSEEKERQLALKDPKQMKLPLKAGGPGSGRKKEALKEYDRIYKLARQAGHNDQSAHKLATNRFADIIQRIKGAEDNTERESGPISRKLGKTIKQEGTQFCVYGDKDPLGCYPSMKKARTVAKGGSFITPDLPVGVTAAHFKKDPKQGKPSTPNKFIKKKVKAGAWEDPNKYGKHADITHHAYKTVKWTVDDDDKSILIPGNAKAEKIRDKYRNEIQKAQNKMLGGVVRKPRKIKVYSKVNANSMFPKFKHAKVAAPGKVGVPSTPNKTPKGVGHRMTSPGKGSRKPNPSFNKIQAEYGEPMAGAMGHAHLDTNLWFTPPSLAKRGKGNYTPTDDPGEKDNKFLDVTKRNSKDTNKQRMKLLKRSAPGGLPAQLPAHTTLVAPHVASYLPGMFSQAISTRPARSMSDKRMKRALGAAQI